MMATGKAKQKMPSITVIAATMRPGAVSGVISAPPILASMERPTTSLSACRRGLSGWTATLDRVHGRGRRQQNASEDDDAGEQCASLAGDEPAMVASAGE